MIAPSTVCTMRDMETLCCPMKYHEARRTSGNPSLIRFYFGYVGISYSLGMNALERQNENLFITHPAGTQHKWGNRERAFITTKPLAVNTKTKWGVYDTPMTTFAGIQVTFVKKWNLYLQSFLDASASICKEHWSVTNVLVCGNKYGL